MLIYPNGIQNDGYQIYNKENVVYYYTNSTNHKNKFRIIINQAQDLL